MRRIAGLNGLRSLTDGIVPLGTMPGAPAPAPSGGTTFTTKDASAAPYIAMAIPLMLGLGPPAGGGAAGWRPTIQSIASDLANYGGRLGARWSAFTRAMVSLGIAARGGSVEDISSRLDAISAMRPYYTAGADGTTGRLSSWPSDSTSYVDTRLRQIDAALDIGAAPPPPPPPPMMQFNPEGSPRATGDDGGAAARAAAAAEAADAEADRLAAAAEASRTAEAVAAARAADAEAARLAAEADAAEERRLAIRPGTAIGTGWARYKWWILGLVVATMGLGGYWMFGRKSRR